MRSEGVSLLTLYVPRVNGLVPPHVNVTRTDFRINVPDATHVQHVTVFMMKEVISQQQNLVSCHVFLNQ
jgi:hypothetical protein